MVSSVSYKCLYGAEPTVAQLLEIVRSYAQIDWLIHLCRFATLVMDGRDSPGTDQQEFILQKVFTESIQQRIERFRRAEDVRFAVMLSDWQVSVLTEIVVAYAPESDGLSEELNEADRERICNALLMIPDLGVDEVRATQDVEYLRGHIASAFSRSRRELGFVNAARAYWMYCLEPGSPRAKEAFDKFSSFFSEAAGVSHQDYMYGGLRLLMDECRRSIDEIAGGWRPVPEPEAIDSASQRRQLEAYYGLRKGTVSELRADVNKWERLEGDVEAFTLIPIRRYPILDLGKTGCFISSASSLGLSLNEGLYHVLMTAALEKTVEGLERRTVGGIYGQLYEHYILDLLQIACGEMLLRAPRRISRNEEAADAIIQTERRILLVQIKGFHLPAKEKNATIPFPDRLEMYKDAGLSSGICQLANSIEFALSGDVEGLGIVGERTLHPVLITSEPMPLHAATTPKLEDLAQASAFMRHGVARIRFLDTQDIEVLPDVKKIATLPDLLVDWTAHEDWCDESLYNYAIRAGYKITRKFMRERFAEAFSAMAKAMGFNWSPKRR